MNKKGFTLIELLAVIAIVAILGLLTTTSVTKIVNDAKNDLSDIQIASIKSAAEVWGAENLNLLPNADECNYITLATLKENGLLDTNIVDPKNNSKIDDSLKIKISGEKTSNNKIIYKYEVNPESVDECNIILIGDVNEDGVVNAQDGIELTRYLFLDEIIKNTKNGDIDGDNKITLNDINLLSQSLGGIKSTIPDGLGLLGDVNGDGIINYIENDVSTDGAIIIKYGAGTINLQEFVANNSDVNSDGLIDGIDAVVIMQVVEGVLYKNV